MNLTPTRSILGIFNDLETGRSQLSLLMPVSVCFYAAKADFKFPSLKYQANAKAFQVVQACLIWEPDPSWKGPNPKYFGRFRFVISTGLCQSWSSAFTQPTALGQSSWFSSHCRGAGPSYHIGGQSLFYSLRWYQGQMTKINLASHGESCKFTEFERPGAWMETIST